MSFKVVVLGATGNAGRQMLSILAERKFPASEVVALASRKSQGRELSYGDKTLKCVALEHFDFAGTDIVLMSAGTQVSAQWAPKIAATGAVVIDVSPKWRMDRDVPLIVPEVNGAALAGYAKKNIVANPSSSTIAMAVALKPLHDVAGITRVVVSTYEAASGAGRDGMDELFSQTKAVYVNDPITPKAFPKQIAFNVFPQTGDFMDSGFTTDEFQLMVETQKVVDPSLQIAGTCVRVPVFNGHCVAANVAFERAITAEQARGILRDAPGVQVVDKREDGIYVSPIEAAGEDGVFVSRVRKDPTVEFGLSLWIVTDNLRKGSALNAVQIAELLAQRYLKALR
jgi:aspartate-semialdehyde dehydrogenase